MTFENRLPANYSFGALTGAAAISDTTLTSTDFSTRLASSLSTTNYVPLTLQDPSTGNFEIVWVTAHTAAASTCTVVRGKEGTSARAWGNGTLWVCAPTLRDGVLPVANRAALPADPHVGLRSFLQDEQCLVDRTIVGYQTMPLGIIGGVQITGSNALGAAISTVETMPTSMNSGTVALMPLRRYRIHVRSKPQSMTAGDAFVFRIREGASAGTAGNQIRQWVVDANVATAAYTYDNWGEYETGASAVSKVFSFTAVRVSGSGSVAFSGGDTGSTNLVGVWVEDIGPAAKLTSIAS